MATHCWQHKACHALFWGGGFVLLGLWGRAVLLLSQANHMLAWACYFWALGMSAFMASTTFSVWVCM